MRYLALSFLFSLLVLTGCTMPPKLQTFAEVQASSDGAQIKSTEILVDTLANKPRETHTEITFAMTVGDSTRLMESEEFCYNETQKTIWIRKPDSVNRYTAIDRENVRVCQEMRPGSKRSYFVRNRALFWPVLMGGAGAVVALPIAGIVWAAASGTAALVTEGVGLGVGALAGIAPAMYFSTNDGGAVRPDYNYCDDYYSEEELENWLNGTRCFE